MKTKLLAIVFTLFAVVGAKADEVPLTLYLYNVELHSTTAMDGFWLSAGTAHVNRSAGELGLSEDVLDAYIDELTEFAEFSSVGWLWTDQMREFYSENRGACKTGFNLEIQLPSNFFVGVTAERLADEEWLHRKKSISAEGFIFLCTSLIQAGSVSK